MKIDIASLIISVLALGSFFVPIAWYQISQKQKTKKLTEKLILIAEQHNLNPTTQEVWGDKYGFGFDQKASKLVYFNQQEKSDKEVVIDLSELEKCNVSNSTKTVKGAKGSTGFTNSIRIQFRFKDPKKGLVSVEIYDGEHGKTLTNEISIANKWVRTVNSSLKTNSDSKHELPLL